MLFCNNSLFILFQICSLRRTPIQPVFPFLLFCERRSPNCAQCASGYGMRGDALYSGPESRAATTRKDKLDGHDGQTNEQAGRPGNLLEAGSRQDRQADKAEQMTDLPRRSLDGCSFGFGWDICTQKLVSQKAQRGSQSCDFVSLFLPAFYTGCLLYTSPSPRD